ncbi:hypothetical protein D9M68_743110 [compost metagenome]
MMRTGRVGQSDDCAHAGTHGARQSAAALPRNCLLLGFMLSPLYVYCEARGRPAAAKWPGPR